MPDGFEPVPFMERIYNLKQVIIACQTDSIEAVKVLKEIALNPENEPMDRIAASKAWLERGYGRPHQSVQVTVAEPRPNRVLELPASGRQNMVQGPVIDAEA